MIDKETLARELFAHSAVSPDLWDDYRRMWDDWATRERSGRKATEEETDGRWILRRYREDAEKMLPILEADGAEAAEKLRKYEGLGEPEAVAKAFRLAQIFLEYIKRLPRPVEEEWKKYLRDEKAL